MIVISIFVFGFVDFGFGGGDGDGVECLGGRTKQKGEQHPPRIFSQGGLRDEKQICVARLSVRCACGEGWVLDCAGWWVAVRAPAACAGWADDVDGDVDITVKKKAETRNQKRERHLALLALPPFTWNSVFQPVPAHTYSKATFKNNVSYSGASSSPPYSLILWCGIYHHNCHLSNIPILHHIHIIFSPSVNHHPIIFLTYCIPHSLLRAVHHLPPPSFQSQSQSQSHR